jgi:hypothetical protein
MRGVVILMRGLVILMRGMVILMRGLVILMRGLIYRTSGEHDNHYSTDAVPKPRPSIRHLIVRIQSNLFLLIHGITFSNLGLVTLIRCIKCCILSSSDGI